MFLSLTFSFSAAKAAQGMQMSVNLSICQSDCQSVTLIFSAAKAAQGMQMSVNPSVRQSVCLSVCLSVTLIFLSDLLVYFIIANRI